MIILRDQTLSILTLFQKHILSYVYNSYTYATLIDFYLKTNLQILSYLCGSQHSQLM